MMQSVSELTRSLQLFKERRDSVLHDDESFFEDHLRRFLEFCERDHLVQLVIQPLKVQCSVDAKAWWDQYDSQHFIESLDLPRSSDEELLLLYQLLHMARDESNFIASFGIKRGKRKRSEWVAAFRSLIVSPFVSELSRRVGDAANLVAPEERNLQAVPLSRIPHPNQIRIFLSHKTIDKPLVLRYFEALRAAGYEPWLDAPDMPAGTSLEREIRRGFSESCAAVFFITPNFRDEQYLASEIDYAIAEKRSKGKKFAIITLCYETAEVPLMLNTYVYKTIINELDGLREILRALPVEPGALRWRQSVCDD